MKKITAKQILDYCFENSGLKQFYVAKKCGVCAQSISHYRHHRAQPQYETLCKLVEFMGFDIVDVIVELRLPPMKLARN